MPDKLRIATCWAVICIVLGYGMQWFSNTLAYQAVQNLGNDPAALITISAKGPSYGFLLTLGTHINYFGFALLLVTIYVRLMRAEKPDAVTEPSNAPQGESR